MQRVLPLFTILTMLSGLLWAGCGEPTYTPVQVPADQARRSPGYGAKANPLFGEKEEPAIGSRTVEDGPYVYEITLTPDPPMSNRSLQLQPAIDNPAGGEPSLAYQWYLNGQKLDGETRSTLSKGEFKRGDGLAVDITVTDINGRSDSHRFADITVANSLPRITTRLGTNPKLNGLKFQAEDADGDPLVWTLSGAPPGVSIGRKSGRIQIDTSQVFATGTYNMEVVAEDPQGGLAKLGFSSSLEGGAAATTELREFENARVVKQEQFSDKEYVKKADGVMKKMDDMTEEEFDQYLEKSIEATEELEAASATETGGGR